MPVLAGSDHTETNVLIPYTNPWRTCPEPIVSNLVFVGLGPQNILYHLDTAQEGWCGGEFGTNRQKFLLHLREGRSEAHHGGVTQI
jgi:hypothetical protein